MVNIFNIFLKIFNLIIKLLVQDRMQTAAVRVTFWKIVSVLNLNRTHKVLKFSDQKISKQRNMSSIIVLSPSMGECGVLHIILILRNIFVDFFIFSVCA